MEVKRDILWRVYIAYIVIAIVCVAIFAKAFYIQQMQGAYWRGMSDSLHIKMQDIAAERGTIYSADGQMLSTSVPLYDVYVDFGADGLRAENGKAFFANLDSLSYSLAALFKDRSKAEYKKILSQGYKKKSRYFSLKKKVDYQSYKKLKQMPLVRLGKNTSGFITVNEGTRLNPYDNLAYRTIGLDRDNAQKIGLEDAYDSVLGGTKGKRLVRFIAGGVAVPVDEEYQVEPENGDDVITTLDTRVQETAEAALMDMMVKSESQTGTCIVMETQTGQIKAIANLGRNSDGTYSENYNYAMRTSEPGSTIKLVTLLSVLSEGQSVNQMIEVGSAGHAIVGPRNVNDAERAPKPVMTLKECFAHSSNVGMGKIAYQTFANSPDKFRSYIHSYRMDTMTGIDLRGETKPTVLKMKKNSEGLNAMVTVAFGYGIQVSPLQTLTLYNAIANNGKMMKPYLVQSIQSDGVPVKTFEPKVIIEKVCEDHVIKDAQDCMEDVVIEGTAKGVFKGSPYSVAGKTGTAHVADGKYGYSDGVYQASFVGYFPAEKPQYTCIVVIKTKPYAPLHYGGQLAAPVFRAVADRLYTQFIQSNMYAQVQSNDSIAYMYAGASKDIKNIARFSGLSYTDSMLGASYTIINNANHQPVALANKTAKNTMPQLRGMTLKDAVCLCENMGLKVSASGKGKVINQSVQAGQFFKHGEMVSIDLN